uniref:Uncharacterized protein n=1 Tax=Anopheles culicifacies TaxID=139723 RepID=A0A182MB97_9DIPT
MGSLERTHDSDPVPTGVIPVPIPRKRNPWFQLEPSGIVRNRPELSEPSEPSGTVQNRSGTVGTIGTIGTVGIVENHGSARFRTVPTVPTVPDDSGRFRTACISSSAIPTEKLVVLCSLGFSSQRSASGCPESTGNG